MPWRSRRAPTSPCPPLTPSYHSLLVPPSQFEHLWKEYLREHSKDFEIRHRSGVTSTVRRQHEYISKLSASNPAPPPMVLSRHGSMPGAPARAPNPPHHRVRAVPVPAPPMMYAQAARAAPSYHPPSSGYAQAARGQVLPRPPAPPTVPPPPRAPPPPPPTHHSQPLADRHRARASAPPSKPASTAPRRDDPYAKYFDEDLKRERKVAYEREYFSSTPRPPRESTPDRDARRDAFDAAREAAIRKAENRKRASSGGAGPGSGSGTIGNQPSRPAPPKRDAPPKRASEERPTRVGGGMAAVLSSIGASRSTVARPMPSAPVGAAAAPRVKADTGFEERARALAEEKRRKAAEKERVREAAAAAAAAEKAAEKAAAAERSKAARMARRADQPSAEVRPAARPGRPRTVTIDDSDTDGGGEDGLGEEVTESESESESETESTDARPAVIDDDEDEEFDPAAAGKRKRPKKRGRGRPRRDDGGGGGSAKKAKRAPRAGGGKMGVMPEERLRRDEAPKQLDEPMEGWPAEMTGGFVHYTRDVYCQAAARLNEDGSFGSIDRIWRRFNRDETTRAFEACDPTGKPHPNKSQTALRSVKAVERWLENNYGDAK